MIQSPTDCWFMNCAWQCHFDFPFKKSFSFFVDTNICVIQFDKLHDLMCVDNSWIDRKFWKRFYQTCFYSPFLGLTFILYLSESLLHRCKILTSNSEKRNISLRKYTINILGHCTFSFDAVTQRPNCAHFAVILVCWWSSFDIQYCCCKRLL